MGLIKKYIKIPYEHKTVFFAIFTMSFNYLWAAFKILSGVYLGSLFIIINGSFTLSIAVAKMICLIGLRKDSHESVKKLYIGTTWLLLISNIVYIFYMSRMFSVSESIDFGNLTSLPFIFIAVWSLGLAIYGILRTKNKHPLINLIKVVGLLTALTDLALTQLVILNSEKVEQAHIINAISGVLIGAIGVIITVYLIVKAKKNDSFLEYGKNKLE